MVKGQIWENKSYSTSLNYLIYETWAWTFVFRKLEFDMIYYAYLNDSPFKYYISLFLLFRGVGVQNLGKPAYVILACSLTYYWLATQNAMASNSAKLVKISMISGKILVPLKAKMVYSIDFKSKYITNLQLAFFLSKNCHY